MKHKKLLITLFAIALLFLILACGTGGPPAIGEVVAAKGFDDSNKPVDPTSVYQAEDTFSISVEVNNLVVGSTVDIKYLLDGEVYESSTLSSDKAGSGYYAFTLEPGSFGHAPGTYTIETYLDGALAKTITVTVEGGRVGIVDVVLTGSMDDENKPGAPKTDFKTGDEFKVSVALSNVKAGSEVKVIYLFAGSDAYEPYTHESVTSVDETGSGYYGFSLSAPDSGWAVGNYTVEAYLDGEMYGSPLPFTVSE